MPKKNEDPLSDVVYEMMTEAKASLSIFRGFALKNSESATNVVREFARYHDAFGGPDLLGGGTPVEILQALPLRMANAFTSIAALVYPDEASELLAYMDKLNAAEKTKTKPAPAP